MKRYSLFVVLLVIISFLAFAPVQNIKINENFGDKINHIVAFSTLFIIGNLCISLRIRLVLLLILYGIFIEIVQYFLPYRIFSFYDILADIIGICVGFIVLIFYNKIFA
jgi:VanZ family protein